MTTVETVECPQALLDAVRGLPPVRTAVANAGTDIVMESVRDASVAGLIEPLLIGDPEDIRTCAEKLEWDVGSFAIDVATDEESASLKAAEHASHGRAGAVMKGHAHTDVFMRALLDKRFGLRGQRRLSHVFHMSRPGHDRALLISDGALNTHPDLETKKAIIGNAVYLAHALGLERPHVALLSATEEPSEHIPSSIDAAALCEWAKDALPEAEVHGPLAFDLAVSDDAARIKGIETPVAGRADVIIVPDIVSGNALFKMMVHFMNACAAGIVLGAKVPILLNSRSDPPAARLASAALAVLASHRANGQAPTLG